jgi:hypothetical protein
MEEAEWKKFSCEFWKEATKLAAVSGHGKKKKSLETGNARDRGRSCRPCTSEETIRRISERAIQDAHSELRWVNENLCVFIYQKINFTFLLITCTF